MIGLWLLILLRRVLAICLLILRRGRVGSLRLVGRLGWRIRAGSLRRVLVLRVLTLWVLVLWRVLGVRLSSNLGWDERLLLLSLLVLLGFHGNDLSRGSFSVKQETASLAASEETNESPGKGRDKEKPMYFVSHGIIIRVSTHLNSPDQSAKASDGRKHVTTGLEEDDVALPEACLAVEHAAIVEASAHRDIEDELGALGSHSSKGCKPKDHHDTVKDNDGDDVVDVMQRYQFLAKDGIQADDPSDEGLSCC